MTPPTADTLAINNGAGTNNRMDSGDTIVIGFSEAIDPNSVCPEGWDGSNRPGSRHDRRLLTDPGATTC